MALLLGSVVNWSSVVWDSIVVPSGSGTSVVGGGVVISPVPGEALPKALSRGAAHFPQDVQEVALCSARGIH